MQSCRLTFLFPFPVEAGTTGQSALQDYVLIVIGVALGFTGRIFRFDQAVLDIVAVGDQVLDCAPGVFQVVSGDELLVIDGDDMFAVVANEKGAPGAVVDSFDTPVNVTGNVQAVTVVIAEGDQRGAFTVVAEMIKLCALTSPGEDKFGWILTEEYCRFWPIAACHQWQLLGNARYQNERVRMSQKAYAALTKLERTLIEGVHISTNRPLPTRFFSPIHVQKVVDQLKLLLCVLDLVVLSNVLKYTSDRNLPRRILNDFDQTVVIGISSLKIFFDQFFERYARL
jgi:hypothetical protein